MSSQCLKCLKTKDVIVIHDVNEFNPANKKNEDKDIIPKTDLLMKGLRAVEGSEFMPSIWSFTYLSGGNVQTLMIAYKKHLYNMFTGGDYPYDKRELFKFSDGGQIYIDYRGDSFVNPGSIKPIVIFIGGMTQAS